MINLSPLFSLSWNEAGRDWYRDEASSIIKFIQVSQIPPAKQQDQRIQTGMCSPETWNGAMLFDAGRENTGVWFDYTLNKQVRFRQDMYYQNKYSNSKSIDTDGSSKPDHAGKKSIYKVELDSDDKDYKVVHVEMSEKAFTSFLDLFIWFHSDHPSAMFPGNVPRTEVIEYAHSTSAFPPLAVARQQQLALSDHK